MKLDQFDDWWEELHTAQDGTEQDGDEVLYDDYTSTEDENWY